MENPWVTKSSVEIYDNPWINVTHREVIAPTGNDGIYGLVHFKNLAIGVIPIDDEDHTWLVGQYRYTLEKYSWEIPAGGGRRSDEPAETAHRELREECGLDAARIDLLLRCAISNSVTDEVGAVFVATELTPVPVAPDETEVLTLKRLPVDEAIAMACDGRIDDSLSLMGLLRLAVQRTGSPQAM